MCTFVVRKSTEIRKKKKENKIQRAIKIIRPPMECKGLQSYIICKVSGGLQKYNVLSDVMDVCSTYPMRNYPPYRYTVVIRYNDQRKNNCQGDTCVLMTMIISLRRFIFLVESLQSKRDKSYNFYINYQMVS